MSGVAWRRVALLAMLLVNLRLMDSIMTWLPGEVGIAVAFVVPLGFMLSFLLTPLREQPQCGWVFPLAAPDTARPQHVHLCQLEHGHSSTGHECRCGLGFRPVHGAEVPR